MVTKTDKSPIFSEALDAQTAEMVRRIAAKTIKFSTGFIGTVTEDGTPLPSVRLEAWQNQATKLWQIDRFTRLPADGVIRQETEARSGLCFFDALYLLARFEVTELEGRGAVVLPVESARWTSVPHYTDAAKAAGQIIDAKDGLPRPCALGRVLTGGFVADADWETVQSTQDTAMEDAAVSHQSVTHSLIGDVLVAAPPVEGTEEDWLAQANKKMEVVQQFKTVMEAGKSVMEGFENACEWKFKTDFEDSNAGKTYAKTIISMGMIPALGYMVGNPRYNIDKYFLGRNEKFKRLADGLPKCPEKELCSAFTRAAESGYWLERAAQISWECRAGKRKSLTDGLRYIERAAAAENLSAVDQQRLKNEYLNGSWERGTFREKLKEQWYDGIDKRLSLRHKALKEAKRAQMPQGMA